MVLEFSAGGVVFKKRGTSGEVNSSQNNAEDVLVLVSQHSYHHGWVFPKGLIGDKEHLKGEDKIETAVREVEEETGAKGEILQELTPITYWYQYEGEKRKKTVYYFLMKYVGGDITIHDHEMEDVIWLPLDQILEKLTYKSDKQVFLEAKPIIEKLQRK